MESVFTYCDYRKFLNEFYQHKKAVNKVYSLQVLADKAGFKARDYLWRVMKGERNLSDTGAMMLSKALHFAEKEALFFKNLVAFNQAELASDKKRFFLEMGKCIKYSKFQKLREQEFEVFSTWYNPVLRSVLPNGIYSLETYSSLSRDCNLKIGIEYNTTDPGRIDTLVLKSPGQIKGVVTRNNVLGVFSNNTKGDAFIDVIVKETARHAVTGTDGSFVFQNMPTGSYTLFFYADDGFFTVRKEKIIVNSDSRELDTVFLQRIPWLTPPKPAGLQAVYDSTEKIVSLSWEKVNAPDLRGYEVLRYDSHWQVDKQFTTIDTACKDTLKSFDPGTLFSYAVRSVNLVFERSYSDGPIDVIVK